MIRKRNSGRYLIRCAGLNVSSFINLCTINGMILNEINRVEGQVEFEIDDKQLKILSRLDTSKYNLEVVRIGGAKRLLNILIYRIGLVIGLVVSIIAIFFLNNRLLRVHVYGLSSIGEQEVVDSINDYGIGVLSSLEFDTAKLEEHLSSTFNFSLVSIITKGNSLIVSVKEELPDISDSYVAITADYNMIIESINVYSGTCMVKAGDIVYKGDTLVEPFIKEDKDIVYVTPCAEIKSKAFFSAGYNFVSSEEVLVRNGNKQIISSQTYLGKFVISQTNKSSTYSSFELDSYESHLSQYFLPITIKKTYAYELQKKSITRDFEVEKDKIISDVKSEAYAKIPNNLKCDKEDIVITPTSTGYLVNVYLECNVNVKYNYNN